jgi:uncharacterized protein
MTSAFFVSDLHGKIERYEKLFNEILKDKPEVVFIGGDILPGGSWYNVSLNFSYNDFINDFIIKKLIEIKSKLKDKYPEIFIILGNDDSKFHESSMIDGSINGIWNYIHNRSINYKSFKIFGYSYIPPSPFQLKDWEKYDVSRFADLGCTHPDEGYRTVPVSDYEINFQTIQDDLKTLTDSKDLKSSIFLFHSPPYKTNLDRAALDGKMINYAPLDVHIGSIAIKRFILEKNPFLTLHGHVHESSSITGEWSEKIGKTFSLSAAYDKEELSLIKFNLEDPPGAKRFII